MNDPTATKTPEVVLAQGFLPFRLLPMRRLPAQYRVNRAKLLNVPSILLDEVIRLAAKARRLEILAALNDLCGHFRRKAGVVVVQHLKGLLMLVLGFAHNRRVSFLTMRLSHEEERATDARIQDQPDRAPPHWLQPLVGPIQEARPHSQCFPLQPKQLSSPCP